MLSGFVAWHFGFGGTGARRAGVHLAADRADDDRLRHAVPARPAHLPAAVAGPARQPVAPGVGAMAPRRVTPRDSIIGAAAGYLSLWSVYWAFKLLTGKEGMGYGDFKLFAALGAWLGWQMLLPDHRVRLRRGRGVRHRAS